MLRTDVDLCESKPMQTGRTGLRDQSDLPCNRADMGSDTLGSMPFESSAMHDAKRELAMGTVPKRKGV